jgi:hypothetical protein
MGKIKSRFTPQESSAEATLLKDCTPTPPLGSSLESIPHIPASQIPGSWEMSFRNSKIEKPPVVPTIVSSVYVNSKLQPKPSIPSIPKVTTSISELSIQGTSSKRTGNVSPRSSESQAEEKVKKSDKTNSQSPKPYATMKNGHSSTLGSSKSKPIPAALPKPSPKKSASNPVVIPQPGPATSSKDKQHVADKETVNDIVDKILKGSAHGAQAKPGTPKLDQDQQLGSQGPKFHPHPFPLIMIPAPSVGVTHNPFYPPTPFPPPPTRMGPNFHRPPQSMGIMGAGPRPQPPPIQLNSNPFIQNSPVNPKDDFYDVFTFLYLPQAAKISKTTFNQRCAEFLKLPLDTQLLRFNIATTVVSPNWKFCFQIYILSLPEANVNFDIRFLWI